MCCNYFPSQFIFFLIFSMVCSSKNNIFRLMTCNLSKRSLIFSVFHIFSYVSNVISLAFMFGYVIHPRLTLCAWTIGVEACLVLCVYPVVSNPLIEGFLSSHCLVWVPQLKKKIQSSTWLFSELFSPPSPYFTVFTPLPSSLHPCKIFALHDNLKPGSVCA